MSENLFTPASSHRPRAGFTLFEMMVTMALFAAFASIAGALFTTVLRAPRDAGLRANAVAQFDGAVRALRADVWSAVSLAAPDPDTVKIETANGRVTWRMTGGRTLARIVELPGAPAAQQQWTGFATELTFAATPTSVTIQAPGGDAAHPQEMILPSQVLLAQRGKP